MVLGLRRNVVRSIFASARLDVARLGEMAALSDAKRRYIIAMTPRSGSSYLCDVMKKTRRFGLPDEVINESFIPAILSRIPARTPDEYLRNVLAFRKSRNGASGFKASWFQFRNFLEAMDAPAGVADFRFIYLTRRDLAAQAVSLYLATSSNVFHTNVRHDAGALAKLAELPYDFDAIKKWYNHIVMQEAGWKRFFDENRVFPLCVGYEEVAEDVVRVVRRIAAFVGVKPEKIEAPLEDSVFAKIGDQRNVEWAHRFAMDLHAVQR